MERQAVFMRSSVYPSVPKKEKMKEIEKNIHFFSKRS
jgi:hypothetical protein